MKEYLLTVFSVIFFSIIISFLIPEGKTNKLILSVVRLITIFVLIQPITKIFFKNDLKEDVADFNFVCTVYSKNQSREMQEHLKEEFFVESKCDIVIAYCEEGFIVEKTEIITFNAEEEINEKIYAYLVDLGYINITVNEQTY
ncbi:MAG: hypothetical protein E7370_01485 [Clostridiales bacterium]|nr:hypothetical protein [Clostridiales bacterium]